MKAKGKEAEILLYGDIGDSWFGGITAKQFADDLKAIGNVDTINLRINSAGGDVFDGLTIYRRLVDHSAKHHRSHRQPGSVDRLCHCDGR
jgi:ATP-dependent Clp protease protease subunit